MSESASPPSSVARRALHDVASAWRRLAQMGRYHGLWGPGVRLMRNISLRAKAALAGALVCALVLILLQDLVRLRRAELDSAARAVSGVRDLRALSALQLAVQDVGRAVFLIETGATKIDLPAVLAREAAALEMLTSALADDAAVHPGLARALKDLGARRAELLAAIARTGFVPRRLEAARAYADAVLPLRAEFISAWAMAVDADGNGRTLREGLIVPGASLGALLNRLAGLGLTAYPAQASVDQRQAVADKQLEARLVLAMSSPQLQRARALLPERAATIDETLKRIGHLLDASARLAGVPVSINSDGEVRAIVGLSSDAYRTLAVEAIGAGWALESLGLDMIEQRVLARQASMRATLATQLLLGLLLLALGAYLMICAYKVLAGGLRALVTNLDELGRGNLAIRPEHHGHDEIGRALAALACAVGHMSALFEAVTEGVAAVSQASREVATGNAGLSGRTGEIRTAIGSVAERTQSFNGAMDRCGQAVDRAAEHVRTAHLEAQRSRSVMGGLNGRMRALQGKSREIGQVIGLVESIAYQTRLLAINASIEAARAGAAGKGFAVVAQEVRALAGRSEVATRRIQGIIESSISEIDEGGLLTERASAAVGRTDEEVEAVGLIMDDIVRLVRDGLSQSREVIGIARDVEGAAGGNARLVRQLSEASAELRDQGDSLKRSVQYFVLG
jgi:methyl-accepting chemotaxis protein